MYTVKQRNESLTHRQLLESVTGESLIAITIRKAVKENVPMEELTEQLRSYGEDDFYSLSSCIGLDNTLKLLNK